MSCIASIYTGIYIPYLFDCINVDCYRGKSNNFFYCSENPWENKAVFMLYTELVIGLFKVILYLLFIIIMVRIYTLPLFAVRPMYLTARAFKKALRDVVLSRRAIHNMNTWYV